jgi:hypothetical protein
MIVYAVIQHGVYDQGVVGIYTSERRAWERAIALRDASDGYHDFRIEHLELDHDYEPQVSLGKRQSGQLRSPRIIVERRTATAR